VSTFTSNLTVPEFALLRGAGFRALAQVMGSSFFSLGPLTVPRARALRRDLGGVWPGYPNAAYIELEPITRAWNDARGAATGRLAQAAAEAGADAVVATRFARSRVDWVRGLIEFSVTGTAVASEDVSLGDDLVLTPLSGQELATLVLHGFRPVGLVATTSSTCVVSGLQTSNAYSKPLVSRPNQELGELSRGPYEARRHAFKRVEDEARRLGATGVVGVRYDQRIEAIESIWSRRDLLVTLHVLGTAIVELAQAPATASPGFALRLQEAVA
jgi:uncharacterized protein YbjQ (UPF0145 family)